MDMVFTVRVSYPPDDQTDWEELGLMDDVLKEMRHSLQRDVFGDGYPMEVRFDRSEETTREAESETDRG